MATLKTIGNNVLGVFLVLVQGVVSAGDRTVHVAIAVFSNEFVMIFATIVAFVLLIKS